MVPELECHCRGEGAGGGRAVTAGEVSFEVCWNTLKALQQEEGIIWAMSEYHSFFCGVDSVWTGREQTEKEKRCHCPSGELRWL